MHAVTIRAMRDELEKIARLGSSEVGRLVNADKEQFPSSDAEGENAKRQHRTFAYPSTTTSSPDPEPRVPNDSQSFSF